MCKKENPIPGKIIAVTNRSLCERPFFEQIKRVCETKPAALILREKDLPDEEYKMLAEKVLDMCREEDVNSFLHSRISIAKSLDCGRIHLSIPVLKSMKEEERRNLRKDFQEISVSCHSMEDMKTAVKNGATQIILGTIFETECKKGLRGKGLEFVREICKACPVPVYAIGGINMERLQQVMDAGAVGGCMMSGFMRM